MHPPFQSSAFSSGLAKSICSLYKIRRDGLSWIFVAIENEHEPFTFLCVLDKTSWRELKTLVVEMSLAKRCIV